MNHTTWKLALMNMATRGIDADIRWNEKGSFVQDAHKDLKADFILANPPFNDEDWGFSKVKDDVRWAYGLPPAGGARKLWFITRTKKAPANQGFRAREGETLFIDARKMGSLIDRTHRELSEAEIAEIATHHYVLTPGRYVGSEAIEDDGIPFEEKMTDLTAVLYEQMRESVALDAIIRKNLEYMGYGEQA